MDDAKSHHDTSIDATPTVNHVNDSCASSFVRSSPSPHIQHMEHPQRRPTKVLGLDLSSNRPGSSFPPSHGLPTNPRPRFTSVAASGVDVTRKIGIEGKDDEDSNADEIIMCVDMRERGTVGCCYYESSTGSLHLAEDIQCGGLDVIGTCESILSCIAYPRAQDEIVKLQIQPTVIILSMRGDESIERYFDPVRSRDSADGDGEKLQHYRTNQLIVYLL